jgi:signal transduction histidine kinase
MIAMSTIGMSVGLTAVMSLLFNHTLRIDMMTTGFVCALVIHKVLARITGHYRRQLAVANQTLERRVHERTIELEDANTALHRAAALEASLRDELMVRDRMATAGVLAAGVSHEIRSPLQVILIAVDEVRETLGPAVDRYVSTTIDDIADAGARIALIVQDLSSFAKPVDDPLSAVKLGEAVASAARLASYKFGPGVTLTCDGIDVPPVVGNSGRLVQLVLNLLANAARATRPDVPNSMRVSAALEGDRVVLAIADTGTGMSPQTQARLFEAFFTTGGDRGGTGLGLVICKSLVEKMGGTIAITSELGVGTTVRLSLQRA